MRGGRWSLSDESRAAGRPGAGGAAGARGEEWATLGHTARLSPDERLRRGLTPSDAPITDDSEPPGPLSPGPLGSGVTPVLPVEDSGRYELEGIHARGGLGRVVRAHDRRLHR